ncbi:MAG TPA: shikimate kinase [Clostridia bacterium]|nr:shikimate kinase [Clostridia bacterium]
MAPKMPNIILVGFMGAGKSTIGRALAKRLSLTFWDSDCRIEEIAGDSIPDIFKTHGEEYFRGLEYKVLCDLAELQGAIISTGGGAVTNGGLLDLLLSKGLVIHLEASKETIWRRLKGGDDRPMLHHGDLWERINELYRIRYPKYMRAHYTVKTDGKSVALVVKEIVGLIDGEIASK